MVFSRSVGKIFPLSFQFGECFPMNFNYFTFISRSVLHIITSGCSVDDVIELRWAYQLDDRFHIFSI